MKKRIARILLVCFALVNLLPLTALAAGSGAPPEKPYEKVAAKSGRWYAEQLSYDGKSSLVIGYKGDWKGSGASALTMEIKEEIVLTGIYIPVAGTGEDDSSLVLTDAWGNVYNGFSTEKQLSGGLEAADEPASFESNTTLIFIPESGMALSKGNYTLTLEGTSSLTGAFLAKGVLFGAYEKYREALIEWELENNSEKAPEGEKGQTFGEEALAGDAGGGYEYGGREFTDPPVFALDAEYQIDEIIVSTYNDGQGALPGAIAVIGENGQTYYSGRAYGITIENIPNAAWKIAPDFLLPAGSYLIALSQPEVLSYDQNGEPLFFVKASIPVPLRPDFTGTYRINLDAFKTSTLMGQVTEAGSSFSLKDFELTVLDKDGELELIGKYEGVPFSQACEVVEETAEKVVARFAFAADLTRLPYKAKISADAVVTLAKGGNGMSQIDVAGTGVYDRAASAEKGADHNTYDVKATGVMTQRELPPFVMTALGKAGGAGSVPGPDNAAQAAAGILFPPLVGLVVNVLQEALKPKVPAKKAVRDKNWYKAKYPGKTDEQLAMIMLADAMGNTDNPDEGDAVSIGDNEYTEKTSKPSGGILSGDYESDYEQDYEGGYEPEPEAAWKPQEDHGSGAEQEEQQPIPDAEPLPQEPETMVLKTSANGAESLYVKDPVTGEWVDSETGGVLDLEKYPEAMAQLEKEKAWNDAEHAKQSRGESEHDRILKENMQKISEKERQDSYENILKKKYGTDDMEKIKEIVEERKASAEKWAETWHKNDQILGAMEWGAVAVGTAADIGVDGLSVIVPGGSGIKAGYKVVKGVAGTMAEAKAKGEDAFTLANLAEGGIKGAADAALDKIPGGDGFVGKALSNASKATLTVAGEGAGTGAGAALRGEGIDDVNKAIMEGMKGGAYKAAAGFVTDQIAGDLPTPIVNRGSFKAVPNLKNVIVSKAGATKIASTFADEYAVKPIVMGD